MVQGLSRSRSVITPIESKLDLDSRQTHGSSPHLS